MKEMGFTQYEWRGKPIKDIKAWCKKRKEKMIYYYAYRHVPSLFARKMVKEELYGKMPSSFWETLTMSDGWIYVKMSKTEWDAKK